MHIRTSSLAFTATALLLAAVATTAHSDIEPERFEASDEQKKKLGAGEILVDVEKEDALHTDVAGVVDAPPLKVWREIASYRAQKEWVPDMMESSKVLKRKDGYKICRSATDMPWPIANRTYKLKVENGARKIGGVQSYVSQFSHYKDSGNIEEIEGYWIVRPFDGDDDRSFVRQYTKIDLGIAVPKSLIKSGTNKRLPGLIEALRKQVGSKG